MSEERAKQAKLATQATKRSNRVRLNDLADVHERCAGIDVHKGSVTVCVSTGGGEGELREYPTTSGGLRELRQWLAESAVTHVVMESTGVYWQPVWQILEDERYRLLLANARHVRNMPGRKTDGEDAAWLATLLRKGLIRGSFVPPAEVRALRDLCRTRATLVTERATVSQPQSTLPGTRSRLLPATRLRADYPVTCPQTGSPGSQSPNPECCLSPGDIFGRGDLVACRSCCGGRRQDRPPHMLAARLIVFVVRQSGMIGGETGGDDSCTLPA